jgi:hypothetical protein
MSIILYIKKDMIFLRWEGGLRVAPQNRAAMPTGVARQAFHVEYEPWTPDAWFGVAHIAAPMFLTW